MMTNDLMDPKTVAKINRLTAAEVTASTPRPTVGVGTSSAS
jgi:hypothetical protein